MSKLPGDIYIFKYFFQVIALANLAIENLLSRLSQTILWLGASNLVSGYMMVR